MRLCEWRLPLDNTAISYGGDGLSSPFGTSRPPLCPSKQAPSLPPTQPESSSSRKRKRGSELIHYTSIFGSRYVYHCEEMEMLTIPSRHDQEFYFRCARDSRARVPIAPRPSRVFISYIFDMTYDRAISPDLGPRIRVDGAWLGYLCSTDNMPVRACKICERTTGFARVALGCCSLLSRAIISLLL